MGAPGAPKIVKIKVNLTPFDKKNEQYVSLSTSNKLFGKSWDFSIGVLSETYM